ncbi:MAG: hypothetical protein ABFC77_09060 [Thermoguttaceae bacterium]
MKRRDFLEIAAAGVAMGAITAAAVATGAGPSGQAGVATAWEPSEAQTEHRKKLIVQPLLRHEIETRKPQTSWRNWGDVHTKEAVQDEIKRINGELQLLAAQADFPLEILPLAIASNDAEGIKVRDSSPADVLLLYAAGALSLDPCITRKRHTIIFVRHLSGPVYDWYENVSNRFLRVPGKNFEYDQYRNFEGVGVDDVVVDDYAEILWRLRALMGVKNFMGSRAVTIGKATGKGCHRAPEVCRAKFGMDIVEVSYPELAQRIKDARSQTSQMAAAREGAKRYLAQAHVTLKTDAQFVEGAFVLYSIFKDLLRKHQAQSFTIQSCMSTVMPIAETTACLPLSVLQDEGYTAFCESDFASLPAGVLLRVVSGKPTFMHNPTFPNKGIVTCAHCTCPTRMDGKHFTPVQLKTHYESDYGAALKVELPLRTEVTLIDPDCAQERWLGFRGKVMDNPCFSICRSQQEIQVEGDWKRLAREIRGSHWMMCCGDYLKEIGYATAKIGLGWLNISDLPHS